MEKRILYTFIYLVVLKIYAFINYSFHLEMNIPLILGINLGMLWFVFIGLKGFEDSKNKLYSVLLGFVLASHLGIFLIMYLSSGIYTEHIIVSGSLMVLAFFFIWKYKGSMKLYLLNALVFFIASGYYFSQFGVEPKIY